MENARDLTLRLHNLLRREHGALAEFLVALADFDRRRLWLRVGYASLFDFLHRELGLSKGAAFYRRSAADLVQRFPELVDALRDGKLCLMTVAEVARVLTPENRVEVLPRFFGLSKREAQALVAELQPMPVPPVRTVVTAVRAPGAPLLALTADTGADPAQEFNRLNRAPSAPGTCAPHTAPVDDVREPTPAAAAPFAAPISPPAPQTVEPLTAELNRIHVTLPRRVLEKLEAARAALSHSNPGAGLAEIIEAGVDLLLERHAKRNGLVKRPRKEPRPSTDPGHVPAHVRREVWKRDGGRCQQPIASGGVCGSTVRVELHHRTSRHRGGAPTAENLTTLCGFHHGVETRREFGDGAIDAIVARKSGRTAPDAAAHAASP